MPEAAMVMAGLGVLSAGLAYAVSVFINRWAEDTGYREAAHGKVSQHTPRG